MENIFTSGTPLHIIFVNMLNSLWKTDKSSFSRWTQIMQAKSKNDKLEKCRLLLCQNTKECQCMSTEKNEGNLIYYKSYAEK